MCSFFHRKSLSLLRILKNCCTFALAKGQPGSLTHANYIIGMNSIIIIGLLIPFLGTTLGAACVLLTKNALKPLVQRGLTGFAAGVMTAASCWITSTGASAQRHSGF